MSDTRKAAAAEAALPYVEPGMKLGLGTGSTAAFFVKALAERVREGLRLEALVATSEITTRLAEAEGLVISELDDVGALDLTIDGADEVDAQLRLIKGGGGALLREKITAAASARMIVIADADKLVDRLGAYDLPVEIVRFGAAQTARKVEQALVAARTKGCELRLREVPETGEPYITDEGHYILDCACEDIPEPERLAGMLSALPGVVEHGLFLGMATAALIAGENRVTTLGDPVKPAHVLE